MDESREQDRIDSRADLLPEEKAAGSDDPEEQAEAILEESDDRTDHPEKTRLESTQTPDPPTETADPGQ
jgi:hypothetical protein